MAETNKVLQLSSDGERLRVSSSGTSEVGAGIVSSQDNIFVSSVANTDAVIIKGGATEYARFLSSGLGIGTTPDTALHVDTNAAATTPILKLENSVVNYRFFAGSGTPQGVITGNIGDTYTDGYGGALYLKTSGTATNTGWTSIGSSGSLSGSGTDGYVTLWNGTSSISSDAGITYASNTLRLQRTDSNTTLSSQTPALRIVNLDPTATNFGQLSFRTIDSVGTETESAAITSYYAARASGNTTSDLLFSVSNAGSLTHRFTMRRDGKFSVNYTDLAGTYNAWVTVNAPGGVPSTSLHAANDAVAAFSDQSASAGPRGQFRAIKSTTAGNSTHAAGIYLTRSGGSTTSPAILADSSTLIGAITAQGFDGSTLQETAAIETYLEGTASAGVVPQSIVLSTGATNTASRTERMRITSAGLVGINTASPNERLTVNGALSLAETSGITSTASFGKLWAQTSTETQGSRLFFVGDSGSLTQLVQMSGNFEAITPTTGSIALDFAMSLAWNRTLTLTGDPTFTTSNRAVGRSMSVFINAGGSSRLLTFPAGWNWLTPVPTTLASGDWGVLATFCTDGNDSGIIAAWSYENATTTPTGTGTTNRVAYWTGTATLGADSDLYFDGYNFAVGTTSPTSRTHLAGSISQAISTITSSQSLDETYHTLICDATSGAITLTLPAASGCSGRIYRIKKVDSSANSVIIDGNGAETIDGAANYTISVQYGATVIQSNGSVWWVI